MLEAAGMWVGSAHHANPPENAPVNKCSLKKPNKQKQQMWIVTDCVEVLVNWQHTHTVKTNDLEHSRERWKLSHIPVWHVLGVMLSCWLGQILHTSLTGMNPILLTMKADLNVAESSSKATSTHGNSFIGLYTEQQAGIFYSVSPYWMHWLSSTPLLLQQFQVRSSWSDPQHPFYDLQSTKGFQSHKVRL